MTFPTFSKDPDQDVTLEIDVRSLAYGEMRRSRPYTTNTFVRAPRHTGFYYECTTAGDTKAHWPDLPRAAGETVTDGSVVWTARHPSSATLPSISSVTWAVDDAALSVDSESVVGGLVFPTLSGGSAGVTYIVTATVTWSTGQIDDVSFYVEVAEE